ncbi:MAG: signal recognition particle protein [candidate division WOR-3 bacterium]|nr:signal recognition particle protein [candidate division WOR-3 bacterium]
MLENLTSKLNSIFENVKNKGKITESDLKKTMREIKLVLLEADVNYKIVKQFITDVEEYALGQDILKSLKPEHIIVKAVNDHLTEILSAGDNDLHLSGNPAIIMLVGLQGTGKTTTCGKLAKMFEKKDKRTLLVPCDVKRPAAYRQLEIVAEHSGAMFFEGKGGDVVDIIMRAADHARGNAADIMILDTAGRLHIDEKLMDELERIQKKVKPCEILYVGDALTGQDAVNSAEGFNSRLDISGIVLTKMDGDQKGGAALSISRATDSPIKFITTGEHIDQIERFHPDRMASRILGMGDIVSLVEKTEDMVSREEARDMEKKLKTGSFDFTDYLEQIKQLRKMGPLQDILKMLPGVGSKVKLTGMEGEQIKKVEAIILSMTPVERANPHLLNNKKRVRRIAGGSGNTVKMVKFVVKQHKQMKKMMKKLTKGGLQGMPPFM